MVSGGTGMAGGAHTMMFKTPFRSIYQLRGVIMGEKNGSLMENE